MKWLPLFISCIQIRWASSCVFEKVEYVWGTLYQKTYEDETGCFAACYEDKHCIALAYRKVEGLCIFFTTGDKRQTCKDINACYTLQRDEEDSMCARYVNCHHRFCFT